MKHLTFFLFMTMISAAATAQSRIAFTVSFSEHQAHYADIQVDLDGGIGENIDLKMPVWTPGSYLVREFARNVESFEAVDGSGKPLQWEKTDKSTWRINSKRASSVKVTYRVYAFEISVRTSFVDDSHAFLSPTSIFMYPAGKLSSPSTVKIVPPAGWDKVSTGLDKVQGAEWTFNASDFDVLYDSPIEVGTHEIFTFQAAGIPHEVAMYGGGNYDKELLIREMTKIIEEQTSIFGVNPNKRYVFIVHNFNSGGGGLEHLNSTVLGASRNGYSTAAGRLRFLSLVAHEYIHLWNVKRLRPIALGPFNYDAENYTTNLWISEGFTSYYQDLTTQRTGLLTPEAYLNTLASAISSLENQPGNRIQPLSESSFDAWIKAYRPNENSVNSTISYYSKGAIIGLLMDLDIINSTKGKSGLDELMKAMYDEYYVRQKRGFTDAEFRTMAEKFAGHSLAAMYYDYINGVKTIDYNKYLGYAGYRLINEADMESAYLGVGTQVNGGRLHITQVARASGAWQAGLSVNDEIVSVGSFKPSGQSSSSELLKFIESRKAGEQLEVVVNRDGIAKTYVVTLGKNPNVRYGIASVDNPTPGQLAVRSRWLKVKN